MLTPQQYQTARELFARAREAPSAARDSVIRECLDPVVRDEVRSLLALDDEETDFLDRPVLKDAARGAAVAMLSDDDGSLVGSTIDGFMIRDVIASGGMGTVYRAQQSNPRREVALKLLRYGITSTQAQRRFDYETQILARLRHPNIAQIYDSGMWDSGSCRIPWFAMEYVRNSRTIIDYAKDAVLDRRERLRLFMTVCDAINHGHQKGVIHRDLKPANILVEDSAGQPVAKVIDFGVAKSTDAEVAMTTMHTHIGQLIGTLPYMSPEQCSGEPDRVDVRSDVYALGVILYELLAGEHPFDLHDKPLAEAARVIQSVQPSKPSTHRPELRGDLETIILKAIEKDRDDRYQGVSLLRADIQRFLENQPIEATPPTIRRQLTLFARRHRPFVAAAAMVAVTMVAAVAVSTSFGFTAQAEAEARRTEQQRAEDINRFLRDMLLQSSPDFGAGPDLTVGDMLDRAAKEISDRIEDPLVEAGIHVTVAEAYDALGRFDEGLEHAMVAHNIHRALLAPSDRPFIESLAAVARAQFRVGRIEESEVMLRETLVLADRHLAPHDSITRNAMSVLAMSLAQRGFFDEAESLYDRAIALQLIATEEDDPETLTLMNAYGVFLHHAGAIDESEEVLREVLDKRTAILGPDHAQTLTSMNNLGNLLRSNGRMTEALEYLEATVEARRRVLPSGHPETLTAMNNLGIVYKRLGRLDEALVLARDVHAARAATLGEGHPRTLTAAHNLARTLQAQNKMAEAEATFREILRLSDLQPGPRSPRTLTTAGDLAVVLGLREDGVEEAVAILQRTYLEAIEILPPDHWHIAKYQTLLAVAMSKLGGTEEEVESHLRQAETMMLEAEARLQTLVGPTHPQTRYTRQKLALLYAEKLNEPEKAEPFWDKPPSEPGGGE